MGQPECKKEKKPEEKPAGKSSAFLEQQQQTLTLGLICWGFMATFGKAPPGDAKVGEKIFSTKCAQCHTVYKGAGHKQGPNLNELFGTQSGTTPGYSYSAANKNMVVNWEGKTLL